MIQSSPRSLLAVTALLACTASLACSSSSSNPGAPGGGADGGAPEAAADTGAVDTGAVVGSAVPAAAFFRGTLADTVPASKAFSDPFFAGVQAQATAAGDTGHDALLGTTDLGTALDQFVGLDTWKSDANMDAVYGDPHVKEFAAHFYAAPPEFATF